MEDNTLYAELIDIALRVENSILEDKLLYLSKKVQLMEYELHSLQDKLEREKSNKQGISFQENEELFIFLSNEINKVLSKFEQKMKKLPKKKIRKSTSANLF